MLDLEKNKSVFKTIVASTIHRDGINEFMDWLETTDFYRAPASASGHGSEPGGLCAHSIIVYKCLKQMQEDESNESIAMAALFHDICKINFYQESTRNVKDENGKWIQVPYYKYTEDDSILPVGHGEKSAMILMKYMKLTNDEICAIRWHMGAYTLELINEKPAMITALKRYKLVLKLQFADSQASFWYNR